MRKVIKFKNGDCYNGEVNAEGQPHGSGHMDYNLNGYYAEYDGQWKDGKRCGKGHYYRFSKGGGARHSYDYKGEWFDDKEHGQGVSENSDETGIIVVGKDFNDIAFVLEDASMRATPDIWAKKVVDLYKKYRENHLHRRKNGSRIPQTRRKGSANGRNPLPA